MSYTVLARRYRSATFDDVVGQEHVAQTLKKAIASGRVAHAYLFCGTRGVGKTSMARILAKALNCERAKGPTAEPCLECESCKAIARGDDIDVIEIDAASNTGVDSVRDLIANSQFMPARSRFKVYIIDEVHMLSKNAFNALLKTLEEPPAHVKFILATTEPEKVLPTILSRCQRYDFRNIPTREIAGHLKEICRQENINADDDALLLIAKAGAGSMRDSLSLLDRLLSIGEKQLNIELIESLLGLPKSQLVFELVQSVGQGDVKAVLNATEKMISSGLSVDTFIASLIEHLRNLLILRTCGPDSQMVEVPGLNPKELNEQANRFNSVTLAQDIAILEELRRNIRTSQAGRAMLDATMVRLALADQFASIAELLNGGDGAVNGGGLKKKPIEGVRAAQPLPSPGARGENPAPSPGESNRAADDDDDDDLPAPGKVWEGPSVAELLKANRSLGVAPKARNAEHGQDVPVAETAAKQDADAETANVEPVAMSDLPRVWQALLNVIAQRGPALHSLVSQGELVGIADGQAVIRYQKQHETFVKLMDRNGKKDVVREALSKVTGRSMGVAFEVGEQAQTDAPVMAAAPSRPVAAAVRREIPASSPETAVAAPSPNLIRITPELVESLKQSEPLIQELVDSLGAQIIKVEEA